MLFLAPYGHSAAIKTVVLPVWGSLGIGLLIDVIITNEKPAWQVSRCKKRAGSAAKTSTHSLFPFPSFLSSAFHTVETTKGFYVLQRNKCCLERLLPCNMKILQVLIFANFADCPQSAKISSHRKKTAKENATKINSLQSNLMDLCH